MSIELNDDQIMATYKIEDWFHSGDKQVFELSGAAGIGKALPLSTPIPTPNGMKPLGILKVGDTIFGKNGQPATIKGVFPQGTKQVYEVIFSDGRRAKCCKDHIWHVTYEEEGCMIDTDLTTEEIMCSNHTWDPRESNFYVAINQAVEFHHKELEESPYAVGKHAALTDTPIPPAYLCLPIKERWELLRGLFDTNRGHIGNDRYCTITFHSYTKALLYNVRSILNSLGFIAIIRDLNFLEGWILTVKCPNVEKAYFFTPETPKHEIAKNAVMHKDMFHPVITIVKVIKTPKTEPMSCLYVDSPDHLFLTNDYLVTHNTTVVKYAIERLGLNFKNVLFLAFQGKAANRLALEGLPARTIHSAIYNVVTEVERDPEGHVVYKENGKPKYTIHFYLKRNLGKKIDLIVIDEASMVSSQLAQDVLSFDIPVIAIGDLNQLPPVFGDGYFLEHPDFILKHIMRQKEGDPIIFLSQEILKGHRLDYGVYGKSAVIRKSDLAIQNFAEADIVLTGTNALRARINQYYREYINKFDNLDFPHFGEKLICRKNNWGREIGKGIFLTNGTTGTIADLHHEEFTKTELNIDFKPDFTNKVFRDLRIDYKHLLTQGESSTEGKIFSNKFEFAYAISVFLSQGSQWKNVLFLNENFMNTKEDRKRFTYTGITRASESVIIVQ